MSFPAISGAAFFDDQEKRRARDLDTSLRSRALGIQERLANVQELELEQKKLERKDAFAKATRESVEKEFDTTIVKMLEDATKQPEIYATLFDGETAASRVLLSNLEGMKRRYESAGGGRDLIGAARMIWSGKSDIKKLAQAEGAAAGLKAVAELESAKVPTTPENIATKVGVAPRTPTKPELITQMAGQLAEAERQRSLRPDDRFLQIKVDALKRELFTPNVAADFVLPVLQKRAKGEALSKDEEAAFDMYARTGFIDQLLRGLVGPQAAPPAGSKTDIEAPPTDPKARKVGNTYKLPDGRSAIWRGTGWELAK